MIRSMTAFARVEDREPWGKLAWELRTLNHRYLEIYLRLPEELRSLETPARELAGRRLVRGKLEATLRFEPSQQSATELRVNTQLAKAVAEAAQSLAPLLGRPAALSAFELLRWPGVTDLPETDMEPVRRRALGLFEEGLEGIVETRLREGRQIQAALHRRCDAIETQITRARERAPEVLAKARARWLSRLHELRSELDGNRIEQEIVLLANKLDIAEELDRMSLHVQEVRRVLQEQQPVGRRLDFLLQELNREANTLGAKSADVETTQAAVEMKVLIEQLREQVQNVE